MEEAVLSIRQAHPARGGRKIAHVLERQGVLRIAPSTVTHILHRHDLIDPAASAAAKPWKRFERAYPDSLWQMDFKGHFATGDRRCHPLMTVLDDWLIRLGILLTRSRLLHPRTNGKDERFHRTLKAEVLAHRHFETSKQAERDT